MLTSFFIYIMKKAFEKGGYYDNKKCKVFNKHCKC